jgi:hypothetical protein
MNFLSTFIKCFATSAAVFCLFVLIIGPVLAQTFNWHGDDPTALFGPEWIWNWAFILSVVCFFVSAFLFERK